MNISEESTKVFQELSDEARDQLAAINDRIQSHEGSWGKVQGGEKMRMEPSKCLSGHPILL